MWYDEEELAEDMNDQDIYTVDGVEGSADNGEIAPWEEGFMVGYLSA
ncbi:MAG: hypothetical protein GXP63_02805 [DPANN group archaeon]|nr:hypothetical protein [DPANN group archaeon]